MRFDVLTLFPEIFSGYLSQSLLKLAIERGLVQVNLHNIRDWAQGKHKVVDDRPYGGGPGMLLKVEPVVESVEAVQKMPPNGSASAGNAAEPGHLIMLTPTGRKLTQAVVEELADHQRLLLLCGRYEGFDDRVRQILQPDEISIGDYILGGGEVPAMVLIDTVIRLVPGVLGDEDSARCDSFSVQSPSVQATSAGGLLRSTSATPGVTEGSTPGNLRLLEGGHFTRPREYRGLTVPEVLISGDHEAIARWRAEQALQITGRRRRDLLDGTPHSAPEKLRESKNSPS
ncbi:MAG TPA: tRNA (guanosine(37)-N1)-methyltransferase TrmD [Pirellulales bacterium]|jgi:tRNA (guanine37-N1)-methyltransferase|nr:tRNA (guanosine(37)-N1)-methyltransferase TrmD [Pirellulales bacterium]